MYLVKVVYRNSKTNKAYYYLSKEIVKVDDVVVVLVGMEQPPREKHAIVVETFPIKEIIRIGE